MKIFSGTLNGVDTELALDNNDWQMRQCKWERHAKRWGSWQKIEGQIVAELTRQSEKLCITIGFNKFTQTQMRDVK